MGSGVLVLRVVHVVTGTDVVWNFTWSGIVSRTAGRSPTEQECTVFLCDEPYDPAWVLARSPLDINRLSV